MEAVVRLLVSEKEEDERIAGTNHVCAVVFQVLLYMWVRDGSRSGSHGLRVVTFQSGPRVFTSAFISDYQHSLMPLVFGQYKRRRICLETVK